ncbi:MAG: AraD1 family protein [Planctomycetaceae bacterium]
MRIVQFAVPGQGRRVGIVDANGEHISDITAGHPALCRVTDVFLAARQLELSMAAYLADNCSISALPQLSYPELLASQPQENRPYLCPPLDHDDPHRVLISGTGLTHTGSMQSRDEMHSAEPTDPEQIKTDSARMFDLGLERGKPAGGERGAAPEWFFKGNGFGLRGYAEALDLPAFALDGGEEPEIVGCYIVDENGIPRRLGFALGNEWSDHETERINYLYLAPSKLRTCGVGPELRTDVEFTDVPLSCSVTRNGVEIYDSGLLRSGEEFMCHSLANCEDHHFKYPMHRQPGDVHLHFFGTSKLSCSSRDWKYRDGDRIQIESALFGAPLINTVRHSAAEAATPVRVKLA